MTQFFALLRLQLLSRYADFKPRNLKNALKEKRGRTIGMFIAILFLIVYLGAILYILETKALDILVPRGMGDLVPVLAVVLSTAGTLVMAFFFIMSSLFLGRDATFVASMPVKDRTVLSAKLCQVWISETLIDAVIILPACILYGTRVGVGADFYVRMILVWLMVSLLPISIASLLGSLLIRISGLWKRREMIMTVGGILLFVGYMFLMMNVGGITGDSAESGEMLQKFFLDNATRIRGMTSLFPPAAWAAEGLMGDWGKLALYFAVSAAGIALVIGVLGIFYRKLSMLQSETPLANGKKGIQKGSIRMGSAFMANVKREMLTILRVPSYAVNILPITFMPPLMVVMMGVMFNRSAESGESLKTVLAQLNPALIMCILAAVMAYMSGMNAALSTSVTREGKGHDFIKALPVNPRTIIYAKLTVGCGLGIAGIVLAMAAVMVLVPGFITETLLATVLCVVFSLGSAFFALSRDVKKPKLDWVTEQEAVKQNFGVLISMLVSWGVLGLLAGAGYLMISNGWGMLPVFAVLLAVLLILAGLTWRMLMKNVDKYYCAG